MTFFPLAFQAPLIAALDVIEEGLGAELRKLLLHNVGLYYLHIDTGRNSPVVYAEWLKELAEANTQMVADIADDGTLMRQADVLLQLLGV